MTLLLKPKQLTEKLKFKKARLEKREKQATTPKSVPPTNKSDSGQKSDVGGKAVDKKKDIEAMQKAVNKKAAEITEKKTEKTKKDFVEKKAAVIDEGQKLQKTKATEKKHQTEGKPKQPKKREKVASNR